MIEKSDRIEKVHSDIRGPLYLEALRMQAAGTPVLKLNTGNLGAFDFAMPASVRQALLAGLDRAVPYCDLRGMPEARQAIAAYAQSRGIRVGSPDDIFICNGVSEAASMLMTALVGSGDEVLLPTPCYSLWSNNTFLGGGVPVFYRCDPDNDWNPDVDDIRRQITGRTKAIVIINPNNPTGAVYTRETLMAIAQIARENHLVVLSDEIYDRLVMDELPTYSFSAIAPDVPCVTFNGLSKSHIICGFRCGWMVFSGPAGELDAVKNGVMQLASMRLCGNALTQLVIPAALADEESTRALLVPGGRIYAQREAVTEELSKIDGITFCKNHAAFYLFPGIRNSMFDFSDDQDFAMRFLHEKNILVIPGRGFDWHEDIRCRIVMLPEAEKLGFAMRELGDFLDHHRK